MPLLSTDEQWVATIEGAPHLECKFWMPTGSTEDQARYRIWQIWTHARQTNDVTNPQVTRFLRLAKVAVAMTEVPALDRVAA